MAAGSVAQLVQRRTAVWSWSTFFQKEKAKSASKCSTSSSGRMGYCWLVGES